MEKIIDLLRSSLEDLVLSRGEKRELKEAISTAKFDKRELDLLRSKIFDLAIEFQQKLNKEQLISWLENTTKLTLSKNEASDGIHASYFSPGTECRSAIIQQLKSAKSTIRICVFTISDNEISAEIVRAFKRGISVKILTDNDKSFDKGSDIESMHNSGVPVKIDRTDSHMHHKFCIIDKERVLTGSYNWTRSAAERNQENIVISDNDKMVRDFVREFDRLWDQLAHY